MTSRLGQARAAIRPALKARLMISGPTGAGKTWTGLKIAEVLAEGGKILVIDTEKESALTYADNFTFVHLDWLPPYEPRELGRTIVEAGREYAVVMVDSASHFWRKAGGTLDIAEGKFTGWKDARPAQEDFVDSLLGTAAHVILCTRSKMEHVQEERNGKHIVRKLGMAAQQDADLEYELNVAIELDMDHRATVSKSRCDAVEVGRMFTAGHEVELAGLYADWLKVGEPPAPQETVDELVARMNALPPDLRVACKQEFVQLVGRPDHLRESRVEEATAVVARFELPGEGDDPEEGPATAPPPADDDELEAGQPPREGPHGAPPQAPVAALPEPAPVEAPSTNGAPGTAGGGDGSGPPLESPPAGALAATVAATHGWGEPKALKWARAWAGDNGHPLPNSFDEITGPVEAALLDHLGGPVLAPFVSLSKAQRGWMHAAWAEHGGTEARRTWISRLTSGRTDSSTELTAAERDLLMEKVAELLPLDGFDGDDGEAA